MRGSPPLKGGSPPKGGAFLRGGPPSRGGPGGPGGPSGGGVPPPPGGGSRGPRGVPGGWPNQGYPLGCTNPYFSGCEPRSNPPFASQKKRRHRSPICIDTLLLGMWAKVSAHKPYLGGTNLRVGACGTNLRGGGSPRGTNLRGGVPKAWKWN